MITCVGLVATDEPDSNGDCFTKEALEQLAKQAKGLPVTFNFVHENPLGKVESASVTDKGLVLEMKLKDIPCVGMYAVPGLIVVESHMEDGIEVIDKLKLTEISLTLTPADKHLSPVKPIKKEEKK